jgi:hypothetical protein
MDADLNLNTSANLPDGSASANAGGSNGSVGGIKSGFGPNSPPEGATLETPSSVAKEWSPEDLARGFTVVDVTRTPYFADDTTGENQVGDPLTYGGFLGRPRGTAR